MDRSRPVGADARPAVDARFRQHCAENAQRGTDEGEVDEDGEKRVRHDAHIRSKRGTEPRRTDVLVSTQMFEHRQQVTPPPAYTPPMARGRSPFLAPSDRALEFGRQYAVVLQRWSDLFASASLLVEANVRLGELAAEAAADFEAWLQRAREAPFAWASPEAFQRFMESLGTSPGKEPPSD